MKIEGAVGLGSFATINLDDYVTDVDNTDAEITWSYSGNTDLTVSIDTNRVATIGVPGADWYGSETITFTATDPGLLSDSDPATFTVTVIPVGTEADLVGRSAWPISKTNECFW